MIYFSKEKKFNKNAIVLTLLIFMFILISAISYVQSVSKDLSSCVFRLHVIANSDSKEDQDLKYKVRDSLINYMNNLCANASNKLEAIDIANSHIEDFKSIAIKVIKDNGYDYDVSVEIGNFEFPTKSYGDISLPSGYYDALRVKIGSSSGQNWWCVMFPPLCFVDVTSGVVPEESKESLKNNLNDEDYSIISNDNNVTNFKFKLVELFNNFNLKIANK